MRETENRLVNAARQCVAGPGSGHSSGRWDAEQVVVVGILDMDRDDVAWTDPEGIAQMDLAVDLRCIRA